MTSLADSIREWRAVAWAPPPKLKPSEWVERYRILPNGVTAEPGPMRLDRTPYVRGILDAAADPTVEEIVWVKPTQVAGSETGRNLIGYWIDADPGPCLVVMPDEKSAKETIEERIRPMLESSPQLRRHVSARAWDNKLSSIKLDSMPIFVGWAGSPQSLASRPCRYVFFDETDKYPPFAGREADPISLGTERTATYGHRKKVFKTSTPTTRDGAIWVAWEGSGDKRYFMVPCPHCGTYQRLVWSQVKWPKLAEADKVRLADNIEQNRLAWYECGNADCRGRIDDRHKPKMLARGRWESETPGVVSKRVGFHLSALYSPWRTFGACAAAFVRADGDPGATMNFRNSWLAEPFEQLVSKREPSAVRAKSQRAAALGAAGQRRVVPRWAVLVHATVDVQQGYTYWQIDAWGFGLRSKRLDVGTASGGGTDDAAILRALEETYRQVFNPQVPLVTEDGVPLVAQEMYVDAKYKKAVVTQFAQQDPARVFLTEGASGYTGPIATPKVEKVSGVVVWSVNTMQSKDTLDRLIGDPDQDKWQVYAGVDDTFCTQLASEHKVLDRQQKQLVWQKKTAGAQNHYWDCSANSTAVAVAKGCAMPQPVEAEPAVPVPAAAGPKNFVDSYKGRY